MPATTSSEQGQLQVLDVHHPPDFAAAARLWRQTLHREPQAHPAYLRLFASPEDEAALWLVSREARGMVILPLLLRRIEGFAHDPGLDAITPYGYSGAFVSGCVDQQQFWRHVDQWAARIGLLNLTMRRSVVPGTVLPVRGSAEAVFDAVVVDLHREPGQIWSEYKGRVRTECRRAQDFGLEVRWDPACTGLEQFHRIYTDAMTARGAEPYFFLSGDAVASLVDDMPGSVVLAHTYRQGEHIASAMHLIGNDNAYYFRSAGNATARATHASTLMLHRSISWLAEQGLTRHILGGGRRRDDSLFFYKSGFAPKGRAPFTVEYQEIAPGSTDHLVSLRQDMDPSWRPTPSWYPPYRSGRA